MDSKFAALNTYGDSKNKAFESLCIHLFEKWARKEYINRLEYFSSVLGDGGDGGIEAYASIKGGDVVGLQAKWFPEKVGAPEVAQIQKSINTALAVRKNLKRYIVCIPKKLTSSKFVSSGKGTKKVTNNTEDARIKELLKGYKASQKGVKIEFWDSNTLTSLLSLPENAGIHGFWFDKQVIHLEYLKGLFETAKAGWLKEKYVPELHQQGKIHSWVSTLLFDKEYRIERLNLLNTVIREIQEAISLCSHYCELNDDDIALRLPPIAENLNSHVGQLKHLRTSIYKGFAYFPYEELPDTEIWEVLMDLEKRIVPNTQKDFNGRIMGSLKKAHQASLGRFIKELVGQHDDHNLVVLGDAGTGKTHGFANAVDAHLESGHPAIIIQAKSCRCSNWNEILQDALPELKGWSETEILNALEGMAVRRDVERACQYQKGIADEPTRVLVCIDGVEENFGSQEDWKMRISEAELLIKRFPKVRFAFSCRSHRINQNPLDIDFTKNTFRQNLFDEPEVGMETLIHLYFKEKSIDATGVSWIFRTLNSPLMLKLFCEEFENRKLADIRPLNTGINKLIQLKMQRIKSEFVKRHKVALSVNDSVIETAFAAIFNSFVSASEIEHASLVKAIETRCGTGLSSLHIGLLLDLLCEHGVIATKIVEPEELFQRAVVYDVPYQSYVDFYLAQTEVARIAKGGGTHFPPTLNGRNFAVELAAISLLADHSILVGENGLWNAELNENSIHHLKYMALQFCPDKILRKRLPEFKRLFLSSIEGRQEVLSEVILRNLYRQELRLGYTFVHALLVGFKSVFSRDLFWSGPDHPDNRSNLRVSYVLYDVHLYKDKHDELPLILAWSLGSVDSKYRERCKTTLCAWAYNNLAEFILLLELMFDCGDPLIREELGSILLGLASSINKPSTELSDLANWLMKNLFAEERICDESNIVIRHGARTIIEKCYVLGIVSKASLKKARPPYHFKKAALLSLDFTKDRESGDARARFPIEHDLAWYVVDDAYSGFLEPAFKRPVPADAKRVISSHEAKYQRKIGNHEFALAAILAFIKSMGWKRKDISWTKATHGSKSEVYTFEEKYVWCAVHKIQGYLADRVRHGRYGDSRSFLKDYSLIERINNPASDFYNDMFSMIRNEKVSSKWIVPNEISPTLNYTAETLEADIKAWVNSAEPPDFSKWILANEPTNGRHWVTLSSSTDLPDLSDWCDTSLDIRLCLLPSSEYALFKSCLLNDSSSLGNNLSLRDPHSFHASYDERISPKDAMWHDWKVERYNQLEASDDSGRIFNLRKTLLELVDTTFSGGETHVTLPSKLMQHLLLAQSYYDGHFYDSEGGLVAWTNKVFESYQCSQDGLYADAQTFFTSLLSQMQVPIWFAFQMKRMSPEAFKKNKKAYCQNCKAWVVWIEDDTFNYALFHDAETYR